MFLNSSSAAKLRTVLDQVTTNFSALQKEWKALQREVQDALDVKFKEEEKERRGVVIETNTLQHLQSLTVQLHHTLPAVLRSGLNAAATVTTLRQDVSSVQKKTSEMSAQCAQLKNRLSATLSDCQKHKQEACDMRREVSQLWEQLTQQSEFSSSLGAATATLLWRVSRDHHTIAVLLSGSKVQEFLALTRSTIVSYVEAYRDDWPEGVTDESCFVLALCGTVTNIAASADGREFLMSSDNGQQLVDVFLSFIRQAPLHKSANIKSVMLMAVYNITINQTGVRYLMEKPEIISLLAWHLKEETDRENRVSTLRLLQSLVAECGPHTPPAFLQPVPRDVLTQLTNHRDPDINTMARDILTDMNTISQQ